MKIRKVIIPKGDEAQVDVEVYSHQPEGVYRYIPQPGDDLKIVLYNAAKEEVLTADADLTRADYVYFNLDTTDLEKGTYTYDVVLKTIDEEKPHHVVVNQELIIM